MSWQATAWAVKQRTGDPALKLLLLTLANYADDEGCCWPSQKTLSEDTEQSVDSVQRKLKQLKTIGLIRQEVRPGKQGRWASRTYFLNMGVAEMSKPQSAARPDEEPCRNEPSTMPQNGGDHAATGTGTVPQSSAAQTFIEPSIEPSERETRTRAKPIPENWKALDGDQDFAEREGVLDIDEMAAAFVDYYRGEGTTKSDWSAVWRRWVRRERQFNPAKFITPAAEQILARLRQAPDPKPVLTDAAWVGIVGLYVKTGRWTRNVDVCGNAPPAPDCRAPKHILAKFGLAEAAA